MSNELLVEIQAVFTEGLNRESFGGTFYADVTGTNFIKGTQTAVISGSTAEALDKGNIGTLGWFFGKNNSATITINIYSAVGGTLITAIPPDGIVAFPFGSGITAPAIRSASASTTAELKYLLVEA
jgi:hypothetical protein